VFRETNDGRTSPAARCGSSSSAATEPRLGAIAPVAPVGLRAICSHVCPRPCTSAGARTDLTIETEPSWSARFGRSPAGKRSPPPKLAGAKSDGVQAPSLRSHVSIWLGAPGRKTKMTFRAVLFVATEADVAAHARADGVRNHESTRPPAP